MPAHDRDHDSVCVALIADGWTITADPLHLRYAGDDLYDPGRKVIVRWIL